MRGNGWEDYPPSHLKDMTKKKIKAIAKVAARIRLSDVSLVAWHEADEEGFDKELLSQHDLYEDEMHMKCDSYD